MNVPFGLFPTNPQVARSSRAGRATNYVKFVAAMYPTWYMAPFIIPLGVYGFATNLIWFVAALNLTWFRAPSDLANYD